MVPLMDDATRDQQGARILIVDDEPLITARVAEMLAELGHVAVVAHDWSSALQAYDHTIDLVLLDLIMPKVDGFKLARLVRARGTIYTPIVFLTGRADDQARQKALEAGGDDFLVKPISTLDLRVRVTAMLRIRRLTEALHRQATVDALTGVGNRHALETALQQRVAEGGRYRRPWSLALFDADHFKRVNDEHGHEVGDDVLRAAGETFRTRIRTCDLAFRFGGEEFVVILPETTGEGALVLAERLRAEFARLSASTAAGAQTLSCGIAPVIEAGETAKAVLARADQALYRAKQEGRDRSIVAE